MKDKTCTCNRFQLDLLPCAHALAYIKKYNLSAYEFCSEYYTQKKMLAAYSGTIYPIPSRDTWLLPEDVAQDQILPPEVKRKPGRPRKRRVRSYFEDIDKETVRCSVCKQSNHNKRTCKRGN